VLPFSNLFHKMADLFISYAKPDRSLATELADELRERGFSV
jgi:hypothetical protein